MLVYKAFATLYVFMVMQIKLVVVVVVVVVVVQVVVDNNKIAPWLKDINFIFSR